MQVGDLVCSIAGVSGAEAQAAPAGSGGEQALQRVAAALQAAAGQAVPTKVLRQGMPLELQLVPRPWSGRGLLGCRLRPL